MRHERNLFVQGVSSLIVRCALHALVVGSFGPPQPNTGVWSNTENLSLPGTHIDLQDNQHSPHFDINSCKSPNLEITCRKQWPPSLVLSPMSKPHNHHYNVLKIFCFPDALELLSEARLSHILSFIFNPRDYVHQ